MDFTRTKRVKNLILGLCLNSKILALSGLVSSKAFVVVIFDLFMKFIVFVNRFSRSTLILILAGPQNLMDAAKWNEWLWQLARSFFFFVFSMYLSVHWTSSVVPSDCLEEKRQAKHLRLIKFWVTPSLAWWSASWQRFLSKVHLQPHPSLFQWSLRRVSLIWYF